MFRWRMLIVVGIWLTFVAEQLSTFASALLSSTETPEVCGSFWDDWYEVKGWSRSSTIAGHDLPSSYYLLMLDVVSLM